MGGSRIWVYIYIPWAYGPRPVSPYLYTWTRRSYNSYRDIYTLWGDSPVIYTILLVYIVPGGNGIVWLTGTRGYYELTWRCQ